MTAAFFADEGPPEAEFHPGVARRMAHKTVAAGALIRDPTDRILFVVPNYKPYLDLPGGIVEPGEPPSAACRREVLEELGVDLPTGRLLVVDWTPGRGPWSDQVQFVFDGGVLDPALPVRPAADELTGIRWLPLHAAEIRASLRRRLSLALTALTTGTPIHAEMGHRYH
ncbi:NUDIX hydrolase [Dactylosporangium sp. NBC_01737]|uniref:NUDIX hydrolase n=1 Tax=Dactylosporangium sp. NBC_01737 TaxID=2975959 RepID=UPI002E0F85FE|nr:NUDIX hydrolase [Dactylosporangium sp. NBC_01737]